jgi:hypothetical protein
LIPAAAQATARRLAALGLTLLGACACSRSDPPAVPAAALPAKDEWQVECRPVKDDLHQACYGPGWEARRAREPGRFHFYQVSVERKQPADAPLVLFVKRLDMSGIGTGTGDPVVSYDAAARAVRFDLGREPIVFPLDAPR